tara:strand:- start:287 stop:448 length:162 start_codon:yes stop_codon:yes gene_type:complete
METYKTFKQKEYLKNKPKYKQKKVRLNIWEKEIIKAEKYDRLVKKMEIKQRGI